MKVAELIEKLSALPPDLIVITHDWESDDYSQVDFANVVTTNRSFDIPGEPEWGIGDEPDWEFVYVGTKSLAPTSKPK